MNVTLAPIFVFCRCSLASSIMHLRGAVFLRRAQIYNHRRSPLDNRDHFGATRDYSHGVMGIFQPHARCLPLANNYVVWMFLLVSSAHDLEI